MSFINLLDRPTSAAINQDLYDATNQLLHDGASNNAVHRRVDRRRNSKSFDGPGRCRN